MKPNKETTAYAKNNGFNHVEYIGLYRNKRVFSLAIVDSGGYPLPIGLPVLSIESEDKASIVNGDESLSILGTFEE